MIFLFLLLILNFWIVNLWVKYEKVAYVINISKISDLLYWVPILYLCTLCLVLFLLILFYLRKIIWREKFKILLIETIVVIIIDCYVVFCN